MDFLPLNIKQTEDTPKVIFIEQESCLLIEGDSYPEDSVKFYFPVFEWFKACSQNNNKFEKVIFKLNYFNSGSSKQIVDLLCMIDELFSNNFNLKILWYYEDEMMQELGEDFSQLLKNISMELVELKS